MPTVAEIVHEILDNEVFLQESLVRGITNRRALSRWLMKRYDVEASLEAIDDAIRKYEPTTRTGLLPSARQLFADVGIDGGEKVTVLTVKRSKQTYDRLTDLVSEIDGLENDEIRVIPSAGCFLVVVDRDHGMDARNVFDPRNVKKMETGFKEIGLGPTTDENPGAGMLGLAISMVVSRGIKVPYAMNGATEQSLLVSEGDFGGALEVLNEFKLSI